VTKKISSTLFSLLSLLTILEACISGGLTGIGLRQLLACQAELGAAESSAALGVVQCNMGPICQ